MKRLNGNQNHFQIIFFFINLDFLLKLNPNYEYAHNTKATVMFTLEKY